MIELKSTEQLSKAIARARASRLTVRATNASRQYRVTNRETGAVYMVNFYVRSGQRFGHCTCKAGQHDRACKHLAAAAGLNVWRSANGLNSKVAVSVA